MILANSLLQEFKSVVPRRLSHCERSPFLVFWWVPFPIPKAVYVLSNFNHKSMQNFASRFCIRFQNVDGNTICACWFVAIEFFNTLSNFLHVRRVSINSHWSWVFFIWFKRLLKCSWNRRSCSSVEVIILPYLFLIDCSILIVLIDLYYLRNTSLIGRTLLGHF